MALIWAAFRNLGPGMEDGVWLIPYKGKVTPVPAYKGLIKRATETGSILSCKPYPICQGDKVIVNYGLDEDLIHEPSFGDQRGALIGSSVVFLLPDGSECFHLMNRGDLEKNRNSSAAWKAAPNTGPWHDWEEAMFLKTVIKQGFRAIPLKSQLRDLLRDDSRLEVGATIESLLAETGQELPDNLGGGEPAGDPAPAPAGDDFLKRREAVWNQIVEKMIPLEVLNEVGIRELNDINAENLSDIEELVQGYQPPKKGNK